MLFRDNRILFFDEAAIESRSGVTLRLNPPEKRGPCMVTEAPWESGGARAASVVEWEGTYRLYYTVSYGDKESGAAFAVSSDGVTWERPDLGAVRYDSSTANNLLHLAGQPLGEIGVFVDAFCEPEHRFKLVSHSPALGGMFLLTSPDGVRFKRVPGHLIRYIADNHMSAFFDEEAGTYRIYTRGWDRSRPLPPMPASRTVVLAETKSMFEPVPMDLDAPDPWDPARKWLESEWAGIRRINRELPSVLFCDDQDPPQAGLYQGAVHHYLPGVYFAFPSLYYSYPWPPEGEFINDGVLDVQFASSRDGRQWSRELRSPYVRLDLSGGWCTKTMHMLTGIVTGRSTLSQYHTGGRRTHGEGRTSRDVKPEHRHEPGSPIVHRLEQRLDGFVSADSAYAGGELVTRPFTLTSPVLCLNIDTSASGDARAQLLNPDGSPISGFAVEDCSLIQGNDTLLPVAWRGSSDISTLVGRDVKLRLVSRGARLFAVYP